MSAAEELMGVTLPNGWLVVEHLARHPNGSGGTFSQSYRVERSKVTGTNETKEVGFLKAFDFSDAFKPNANTTEMIQMLISAYNFERDVLTHCQQRGLSNIVLAVDHGHVQVPGRGLVGNVLALIFFEMAKADVRCQLHLTNKFDALWCMRALKDVSLGLWQINRR